MVEGNQNTEHTNSDESDSNIRLIAERMKEVDSKILSPSQRAERILALVRRDQDNLPSVWDVVCFAAEYIGSQVATLPFLEDVAKEQLMLVYAFHYEYPATIDPTYPNDESNSNQGKAEASVNDAGNNSGNESHG